MSSAISKNKADRVSTNLKTMVGNTWVCLSKHRIKQKSFCSQRKWCYCVSILHTRESAISLYLFPSHSPMLCALASSSLCTPRCLGAAASEGTSLLWWYPATSGTGMRKQKNIIHVPYMPINILVYKHVWPHSLNDIFALLLLLHIWRSLWVLRGYPYCHLYLL